MKFDLNNPRTLATTAIMTALVLGLTLIHITTTPTGGYIHFGDIALYFAAFAFGPWVGLVWWTTGGRFHPKVYPDGPLGYIDKTLVHYTPDTPEGKPYSQEMLDKLHDDFLASRMRMFHDVVYNQFGHLNGNSPKSAVRAK